MKMNRTNTAGRILALLLTALMVLSLAACATKGGDKMDGMSSEPKNAEEAVAMHKELMAQENAILSENTALWEKVFIAADKGMTMQEDGKNYGEFLLDTIEGSKDQFTEDELKLLKEAAEESGLCEELFRSFDERPKSFLYSIAMDPYSFSMNHVTPKGSIEQQVYLATYDTIKKLADKGPCVLIGRCADYALKDRDDVINLFITAPLENRIKRVAARNGISENEAKDRIKKTDKSRASYYNYYSAKDWGDAKSYDLCIDSSLLGIDGTVELLKDLIRIKGIK